MGLGFRVYRFFRKNSPFFEDFEISRTLKPEPADLFSSDQSLFFLLLCGALS